MSKRGRDYILRCSAELFNLGAFYRCGLLTKIGATFFCGVLGREKSRYLQPHNIRYIDSGNSALDSRLIEQEHGMLKRRAKWGDSKETKRLY